MHSHTTRRGWLAALMLLSSGVAAAAQTYPAHFVNLMVPFGAGSGTDIVARIIAARASEVLGQQIVVENVGGAGGTIGVGRVAKAAPDGYQIVLGAVDTFAQSQFLFSKPLYNTLTDFTGVALAIEQPLVLIVRNDLPVSNLKEFAAYLKEKQTAMRFGSAGVGAAPYLACSMITNAIGASATHVPYRSAAPALQDMVAGDIDYYCPLAASAVQLIDGKKVKALAVLTQERSPLFPDLPTAREQGIDVVDGYYWMGFFAPKGTPETVIATLNKAITASLDTPAVQARLRDVAATVVPAERRTSSYLQPFLASEITKWTAIMKANGVTPQ